MNALRGILLAGALALLAGCTGTPDGVRPVHNFQADRYLGNWYEIARLDHSFERGLTDITATYSQRKDGGLDVVNRGWDAAKGEWREAQGHAYFLDTPDVASLKVSFFGPFYGGYHVFALDADYQFGPFYGGYHVFALDADYQWAMISGPSRDYFWILSRQPTLDPVTLATLLEEARRAGFNTQALIISPHTKGDTP